MTESTRPLMNFTALQEIPPPPTLLRLFKLTELVESLVDELAKHQTIAVHHRINQSFYMEKSAEMKLLCEQLTEAHQHLSRVAGRANHHYQEIFCRWQNDVRWLRHHLRTDSTDL